MQTQTFHRALRATLLMSALALASAAAPAADLKIAVAADVTSIDPHFFNLFPTTTSPSISSTSWSRWTRIRR